MNVMKLGRTIGSYGIHASIYLYLACLPGYSIAEQSGGNASAQYQQYQQYSLEEITVSARGVATPVSLTPGGVDVAEQQELREQGGASVVETLARIPGVARSNDSPWSADVIIRGMARDSVVVLVDGQRVNMTTDINGRFGLVPAQQIDRMEVLKGPVSALYGAGSVGGVVNIITRQGHFTEKPELHGSLSLSGSTNPAGPEASSELTYSTANAWISGSLTGREHTDYVDGEGDRVNNSQYTDYSGSLAAGLKWSDVFQTRFKASFSQAEDVGIPGTGTAPLPVGADVTLLRNTSKRFESTLLYTPKNSPLEESSLQLGYHLIERNPRIDAFPSGTVAWIEPKADHETISANWRNRLDLGDHQLVIGVEAWNWYMTSSRQRATTAGKIIGDKPTPNTTQYSLGVYGEDDWHISSDWIVNLGLRSDYVEIVNDDTPAISAGSRQDVDWAGHLGLTHILNDNWSLTALTATSYRTPNILELFKNISLGGGITEIGNPELDPEHSLFFEIGTHFVNTNFSLDASAFANFVDDLIVSSPVSSKLYQMDNISSAELYGCELAAEWRFATEWKMFGNVSYTQGRDVTAGEPLRFIPPLNGLVGVRQNLDNGFWWQLDSTWNCGQHETPEDVDSSSFYALLNARCGYAFDLSGYRHSLNLGITNLLDRQYANYLATSRGIELQEPGISAMANWTISF